jgi:Fe-S-cluster containining protein
VRDPVIKYANRKPGDLDCMMSHKTDPRKTIAFESKSSKFMKTNKARNLLKQLYHSIDADIDPVPKVCKKGCYFCCYQPIEILTIEKITLADHINQHLGNETKEVIKANTIKWLDFFDNNTPVTEPLTINEAYVDFRAKAKNIPVPCPLLINGECSVYKVRPLPCRVHYVNDDSKLCEADKLRNGAPESIGYRTQVVEDLKTLMDVEVQLMPYALVEILKIDRKVKKIEKAML